MVWKIARSVLVCLLICVASASNVHAYQIYEGTISSTYLTYFTDILNKHSPVDDYIIFRNAQYEYIMLVGDLTFNGSTFTGSDLVEYSCRTEGSTYNSNYKIYKSEGKTLSLNAGNEMIYSNLGYYPTVEERGDLYEFATLTLILIIALCVLVRPMFKFTYRPRYRI